MHIDSEYTSSQLANIEALAQGRRPVRSRGYKTFDSQLN